MKQKTVGHLHIMLDQINKLFEKGGKAGVADHAEQGDPDDTFIDLYVALVSQPSIGKSLLGKDGWAHLQKRLKPGQQAVLLPERAVILGKVRAMCAAVFSTVSR